MKKSRFAESQTVAIRSSMPGMPMTYMAAFRTPEGASRFENSLVQRFLLAQGP